MRSSKVMWRLFRPELLKELEEVQKGAEHFAKGDLDYRLPSDDFKMLGGLSESLNDMVVRLKQLEGIRRDFVANVSHELKTPITSIKGFVETLQDGALDHPDEAKRFLGIIAKHADRLNAIIEDLLSLARIEQEADRGELALTEGRMRDVLTAAIQNCQAKAQEKEVTVELACHEELSARMNPSLLEQAVTNLIDNAVKYSEPGQTVHVGASRSNGDLVILVRDDGPGIPAEHLPRLFERFYRVDKARSRVLGGTGLGLAIVKHIVLAHGGRVSVDSEVGQGTTFSLHLPARAS